MTSIEMKDAIIAVLEDKLAGDITIINIEEQTSIADYFIIATGKSTTQVKAIVDAVDEKLELQGVNASRIEGLREGRWVVMDYSYIIVHVFNAETRDFYNLEKLWSNDKNTTKLDK